jgi:hypothetical protein
MNACSPLPATGAPFGHLLGRVLVPTFPDGLLYRVEPHRIYMVAVMYLQLVLFGIDVVLGR